MKHIVHDQLDLYFESIPFLVRLYNDESATEVKNRVMEQLGDMDASENLSLIFDDIIALGVEISRTTQLNDPLADLLFKKRANLLPLVYALWRYRFYDDPQVSTRRKLLYDFVTQDNDVAEADDSLPITTEAELFAWLEATDLATEEKYALALLYMQFDRCTEYVQPLIEAVSELLRDRLPLFQPRIDSFIQYVNQEITARGINFISDWVNVKLDDKDFFHIYPTLNFAVMVYIGTHPQQNLIMLGISVRELLQMEGKQRYKGKRQAEFLKALSDNTKLSILLRLKQEKLYSGQLAAFLSLTGPTISHHMNTLVQLQLVTLEKQGNRVYYSLNKANIATYIDELRQMLVE